MGASDTTIHPGQYAQLVQEAALQRGFRVEPYGDAAGCPLYALTRRARGPKPRIYLSAGIHGDEPAPPLAVLALISGGFFDDRAHWLICPLLNPAGFVRATRENADGVDLNRDYRQTRSQEISAHIAWLQRQPNFTRTGRRRAFIFTSSTRASSRASPSRSSRRSAPSSRSIPANRSTGARPKAAFSGPKWTRRSGNCGRNRSTCGRITPRSATPSRRPPASRSRNGSRRCARRLKRQLAA
jgi:hypothetical protein